MMEIGGYIELDTYHLPLFHEDAIALNSGRNCLAYLIQRKGIKKIKLPYFLCDSVGNVCKKNNVTINYYHIDESFMPIIEEMEEGEWLYLVNYYGQIKKEEIVKFVDKYKAVIVDNAQAYFDKPIENVDTIYTCRKFFGVADGAFLYTDAGLEDNLEKDYSYNRMKFLLGRYEKTASEFYSEYADNNKMFANEPIKAMSKLTDNLLRGIDYNRVKDIRTKNYKILHDGLKEWNRLKPRMIVGGYAYPLWLKNGAEIRKKLAQEKIYIATLWPNVLKDVNENSIEYDLALNILPLPCDQRYGESEMNIMIKTIKKYM